MCTNLNGDLHLHTFCLHSGVVLQQAHQAENMTLTNHMNTHNMHSVGPATAKIMCATVGSTTAQLSHSCNPTSASQSDYCSEGFACQVARCLQRHKSCANSLALLPLQRGLYGNMMMMKI